MSDVTDSLSTLSGEALENLSTPFDRLNHALFRPVDALMEQASHLVSCEIGCNACCNRLIITTRMEAVAISEYLIKNELMNAALEKKIREHAAIMNDYLDTYGDDEDMDILWFQENVACPFLNEKVCSIYSARPLICRLRHSTSDPVGCSSPESSAETLDDVMEALPLFEKTLETLSDATADRLREHGLLSIQLDELLS